MAKLPVEIVDLRIDATQDLTEAISKGNRAQEEIDFILLGQEFSNSLKLNVLKNLHSGTFFDAMAEQRRFWRGFHPFLIAFVDSPLHSDRLGNLFGTRRGESGLAVVTTFRVEGPILPTGRMAAYFLYELASHSLAFIVSGKKHHRPGRGCLFDLKEDKRQIVQSMKGGALCDECREWFIKNGNALSPSQLSSVDQLLHSTAEMLVSPQAPSNPSKPLVFVGSSVEGLAVARAIQSELQYDFSVEIWNQNTVFGLGTATIEALEEAARRYEYAILIFTGDDQVARRDDSLDVPRDNVVFEAGLFIGSLSRFRCFIVCPRDTNVQLPTDLNGLTVATYDPKDAIGAAIGPACNQIRTAVARIND